jgi:transcriptional regulator with XRE-family HTH domain
MSACPTRGRSVHLDRTLDAVGPRLKQLRMHREITLTDLAAETGISISTLSRLEAGLRRPTLEQLLPLARACGVTLDELAGAPPTGNSPYSPIWGHPVIQVRPPHRERRRGTRPSDPRGLRLGLCPQRQAPPGPRRTRPHSRARGGRRVRHPHPALVRGYQFRSPSSSSASSASKVNAPTFAQPRKRICLSDARRMTARLLGVAGGRRVERPGRPGQPGERDDPGQSQRSAAGVVMVIQRCGPGNGTKPQSA